MKIKKFTILCSPVNEVLLLKSLDLSRSVHLKRVKGQEFDDLRNNSENRTDYVLLNNQVKNKIKSIETILQTSEEPVQITLEEIKEFTIEPERTVSSFISEIEAFSVKLSEARAQEKVLAQERQAILDEKNKLNRVKKEFKCLGVGRVQAEFLNDLFEQLARTPGIFYEHQLSNNDNYVYIFGPDDVIDVIEVIFRAFEVEDVVDSIEKQALMFAFDHENHSQLMYDFNWELVQMNLLLEDEKDITAIQSQIDNLNELIAIKTKDNFSGFLRKIRFYSTLLEVLSDEGSFILRTKLVCVLQGWIEESSIQTLSDKIIEIKKSTGEMLSISFEEPSEEEKSVPTISTKIKPPQLQTLTALTSLRGWPSFHEFNPSILNIFIFCFQFGLMFGDVGQGLIIVLLGLIFCLRAKGIACKIGSIMIPMGVFSIIFGFMYGEVFLLSGIIEPLLYSPIHHIGKFMRLILGVALIEMLIGLVISALNHIKKKETLEAFGEHGVGAALFVSGLYISCMAYLGGLEIGEIFNYWSFNLALAGLALSAIIPFISSLKHGSFSIEVLGEVVGALMMTMVESLSGFFSFLRIAAFAFAHGALGIATHALSITMSPVIGVIITNGIALTFEFISSTIQSLRLLYHEFMGKFYVGDGIRFKPFRLKVQSPQLQLVDEEVILTELEDITTENIYKNKRSLMEENIISHSLFDHERTRPDD